MKEGIRSVGKDSIDISESPKAKEEWVDAFLEGTSRFPLGFFGSSMFMGEALFSERRFDHNTFSKAILSQGQIRRAASLAEAHHTNREVELTEGEQAVRGNPQRPRNARIEMIWYKAKAATSIRLENFARILLAKRLETLPPDVGVESSR